MSNVCKCKRKQTEEERRASWMACLEVIKSDVQSNGLVLDRSSKKPKFICKRDPTGEKVYRVVGFLKDYVTNVYPTNDKNVRSALMLTMKHVRECIPSLVLPVEEEPVDNPHVFNMSKLRGATIDDPIISAEAVQFHKPMPALVFLRAIQATEIEERSSYCSAYGRVLSEGALFYYDRQNRKCLLYNNYQQSEYIAAMLGKCNSRRFAVEIYRSAKFPEPDNAGTADDSATLKINGRSIHRPHIYIVRLFD